MSDIGSAPHNAIKVEDDSDLDDADLFATAKGKERATTPPMKKVKMEAKEAFPPIEKKHMFPVGSPDKQHIASSPYITYPVPSALETTNAAHEEVSHELQSVDHLYNVRMAKPRKTQADKLFIAQYPVVKSELMRKRDEYARIIKQFKAHITPDSFFTSPVKQEVKPVVLLHSWVQSGSAASSDVPSTPAALITPLTPQATMKALPEIVSNDASGSRTPLHILKVDPWNLDLVPIASGSNIQLHSDTIMDMISDPMFNVMDSLTQVDDRASACAYPFDSSFTPGAYDYANERYDDDGNFFGRGRDNFIGPKAEHGECVFIVFAPSQC